MEKKQVNFSEESLEDLDKIEKCESSTAESLKKQNQKDGYPKHHVVVHQNVEDYPFAGEIPLSFTEKPEKPKFRMHRDFEGEFEGFTTTLPLWSGYRFQDMTRFNIYESTASSPEDIKESSCGCGCFSWLSKLCCIMRKKKKPEVDKYYPEYD